MKPPRPRCPVKFSDLRRLGLEHNLHRPDSKILAAHVERLREQGLERDEGSSRPDWTPLHWFAASNADDALALVQAQAAVEAGWDVNAQSDRGDTALHVAAWARHPIQMAWLLLLGADPNIANHKGHLPFHHACTKRSVRDALVLLEAGSRMDLVDADGKGGLTHYATSLAGRVSMDSPRGRGHRFVHEEIAARELWERLARVDPALWQAPVSHAAGHPVAQLLSPQLQASLQAVQLEERLPAPPPAPAPRARL